MKKLWIGLGLLVIASVTVYGVVATVGASNAPQSAQTITAESADCSECPLMKQTAAVQDNAGECPYAAQMATADGGCCGVSSEQTVAVAEDCCEPQETTTQQAANNQLIAEKE